MFKSFHTAWINVLLAQMVRYHLSECRKKTHIAFNLQNEMQSVIAFFNVSWEQVEKSDPVNNYFITLDFEDLQMTFSHFFLPHKTHTHRTDNWVKRKNSIVKIYFNSWPTKLYTTMVKSKNIYILALRQKSRWSERG